MPGGVAILYPCGMPSREDQGAYVPTRRQIDQALAEIRAGWSEREHRRRADLADDIPLELRPVSFGVPDGRRQGRDAAE